MAAFKLTEAELRELNTYQKDYWAWHAAGSAGSETPEGQRRIRNQAVAETFTAIHYGTSGSPATDRIYTERLARWRKTGTWKG